MNRRKFLETIVGGAAVVGAFTVGLGINRISSDKSYADTPKPSKNELERIVATKFAKASGKNNPDMNIIGDLIGVEVYSLDNLLQPYFTIGLYGYIVGVQQDDSGDVIIKYKGLIDEDTPGTILLDLLRNLELEIKEEVVHSRFIAFMPASKQLDINIGKVQDIPDAPVDAEIYQRMTEYAKNKGLDGEKYSLPFVDNIYINGRAYKLVSGTNEALYGRAEKFISNRRILVHHARYFISDPRKKLQETKLI